MTQVFRRREEPLDEEVVNGIIRLLMGVDAKLDQMIRLLEEDDGEEEADA